MKKALPFAIGFLPLFLGFIFERMIMAFPNILFPYWLINCVCLGLWGYVGYKLTCRYDNKHVWLLAHAPAAVALVLIIVQETVVGRYWAVVGVITQWFFTPFLRLPVILVSLVPIGTTSAWLYNVVAFAMMVGAFYWGSRLAKKV